MTLAGSTIKLISRRSAARFEKATQDPVGYQQRKLLEIVQRNAGTEYGQRHGFDTIQTVEDYRRQVPVVTFEAIAGEIRRMLNGERNVLTAEDPIMFAQTSGSTGEPKYIPVTPTCEGHDHKDVMRTWLWHAAQAHRGLFAGMIASLVSPAIEGKTPAGIPFGATSGHIYRNIPRLVQRAYALPYSAFEVEDYQSKYYVIMRTAVEQNVSFLCTANPSSILKLCEKGNEFSESIIRDIRDGGLSEKFQVEPPIRSDLERRYKPNPECARKLEAMRAARGGLLKPADYWPNLALIGCWKGGTVGHYLQSFGEWFDPDGKKPVPVRDWGYLASEMRGSVPISDEGSWGVLTVATNFYEFVPVDEVSAKPDDAAHWNFLGVDAVEEGKEYYIFVTTSGGLYRYDINDVIEIAPRYNRTPQVVFKRKGRGMTNLTGEKLSVNQVISAVQKAAAETGLAATHFKAEADQEKSRYVFRVEFNAPPAENGQRQFLRAIEHQLAAENVEYKAKRASQRLNPPILHVMREGWYERKRRELVSEGKRVFQVKTEILSGVKTDTESVRPELMNVVEYDEP